MLYTERIEFKYIGVFSDVFKCIIVFFSIIFVIK